jgi:hypothetical protein
VVHDVSATSSATSAHARRDMAADDEQLQEEWLARVSCVDDGTHGQRTVKGC